MKYYQNCSSQLSSIFHSTLRVQNSGIADFVLDTRKAFPEFYTVMISLCVVSKTKVYNILLTQSGQNVSKTWNRWLRSRHEVSNSRILHGNGFTVCYTPRNFQIMAEFWNRVCRFLESWPVSLYHRKRENETQRMIRWDTHTTKLCVKSQHKSQQVNKSTSQKVDFFLLKVFLHMWV